MRHVSRNFVLVLTAVAATLMPVVAHAPPAQKQSFEVASVRLSPNQSLGGTGLLYTLPGGKLTANAAILRVLIFNAYGLQSYYQLIGGPDWMDTARWNIDAKAEGNPTQQQIIRMLQTLLEDRFSLKVHGETRELPAYDLSAAEAGIKLQESKESDCLAFNGSPVPQSTPGQRLILPCGEVGAARGPVMSRIDGGRVSMIDFVRVLANTLGRPVIDKTGFTGTFDVDLVFADDDAARGPGGVPGPPGSLSESASPTIFTAIQKQLGLKLESTKATVEVLVIDSVQKPLEN